MKKILILLTITLLLAACSSDSDPAVTNDGRRVPLQVTGYIADIPRGITRAYDTSWESGDKIGLYVMPHDNTETPIDDGSNVCYVLSDSPGETYDSRIDKNTYKAFTTSTPITLPTTGSVDVYGYYPYSSGAANPTAVAVNVSTQNSQKSIDLMTTGKVERTTQDIGSPLISIANPECQLLFQHKLTKLVFNLNLSEMGTVSTTSLTIGSQRTTATYNLYTNRFTFTGDANQTITAVESATVPTGYDKTFEAIVLPNNDTTNPAVDRKVTIVVNGRSYTFTIGNATSFASGHKYIYNVTVYPFSVFVDSQKFTEQW